MHYLALDLELNQAASGPRIIQVGVALGSSGSDIATHSWLLDPQEAILPRITELTGISDEDIATQAVSHAQMAKELTDLAHVHRTFVNPVVWGHGDVPALRAELTARGIPLPLFGRREIDLKTVYTVRRIADGLKPAGGLRSALSYYGLRFEGTPHRADADALNTLRLFFNMIGQ